MVVSLLHEDKLARRLEVRHTVEERLWTKSFRASRPHSTVLSPNLAAPSVLFSTGLIKGNIAEEVARLKQEPGKDILVFGSGVATAEACS